jgi:hypothetical protein
MVAHNTLILNLKVFLQLIFAVFPPPYSGVICVRTMQFLVIFDTSEVRLEVVSAARWRRRANPKSPVDSHITVSY